MKRFKLSIENFVHGVMVVFAIASISNIANYLSSHDHNAVTSYGLGIALGGVLVAVSIMLTHVDYDNERKTFLGMLATVITVGLLSGTVQMWSYAHGADISFSSVLMGYGFPIVGEGVLAVACSIYTAAEKRKRIRNATDGTQERIAEAISEALSDIDTSKVHKFVERKVDAIVRAQVDAVASQLIPPAITVVENDPKLLTTDTTPDVTPNCNKTPIVNTDDTDFSQRMTDGKRNKTTERRNTLLDILRSEFNGIDADELNKSALADRLDVTRQTVGRDLDALQKSGQLNVNGVVQVL